MKVLDGTINRRARESRGTRDEGDASSPQPFGIEGSDEVLLPLIEVGEQRGVFLLQFFFSAHTGSIPRGGSIVTAIILRAHRVGFKPPVVPIAPRHPRTGGLSRAIPIQLGGV